MPLASARWRRIWTRPDLASGIWPRPHRRRRVGLGLPLSLRTLVARCFPLCPPSVLLVPCNLNAGRDYRTAHCCIDTPSTVDPDFDAKILKTLVFIDDLGRC